MTATYLPPPEKPRRFRDPVYDLYTFNDGIDGVALRLIETAAFQRLRRIKQLGFADHVYPGASHSRFAHSLGVYAGARSLIRSVQDKNPDKSELFDAYETEIACFAALLHDIGHGPLSHVFEKVHRRAFGASKRHEEWTEEIVTSDPDVSDILSGHSGGVADLLRGRRLSCWSAIVSSALDADRLDYVRRDRLMSGTGTGAIDFTWILEHARLSSGPIPGVEEYADVDVRTFAVNAHALQQAEIFLLARYQLYDQVYFHKVCRGFECMLVACLDHLARLVREEQVEKAGLSDRDPFVRYFRQPSLGHYLALDDAVLSATLQQVAASAKDEESKMRNLASWIIDRKRPHGLDLERLAPNSAAYDELKKEALQYASGAQGLEQDYDFFFDEPELSIYGKGEAEKTHLHKRLWIEVEPERLVEITDLSAIVAGHPGVRQLGRLFFRKEECRDKCREHLAGWLLARTNQEPAIRAAR
jgi:uncharacterized protein